MRPTEIYDVAGLGFDIYKVLLSLFLVQIHPGNPAELNTRSILLPCVARH
jgi:hypothetical protein